jgi:hypothetical protein
MPTEAYRQLPELEASNVSTVALRAFFNITKAWGLTESEEKALLGNPPETRYNAWRAGDGPAVSEEELTRISYVLGIYKNLRLLFPAESRANAWVRKPNLDFDGEPSLNRMCQDLASVRHYLDYFVDLLVAN